LDNSNFCIFSVFTAIFNSYYSLSDIGLCFHIRFSSSFSFSFKEIFAGILNVLYNPNSVVTLTVKNFLLDILKDMNYFFNMF